MSIAIKDFKHLQRYTKLIERKLFNDLWDMIYKPMFKLLDLKAKNEKDILIDAIDKGLIFYDKGGFRAKEKFSNVISQELIKLGATYDRWEKAFMIPLDKLPKYLLQAITENVARAQKKLNNINNFLADVDLNLNQIIDTMIFNTEVDKILTDVDGQITRNIKNINVIEYELTESQKEEIAHNYTNNMQFYIKKWAAEKIPQMRQKVQQAILEGYREDQVQKMLETEYGIMQRKAEFLAQNETSIMLAQLKKVTYTKMGFEHFIWHTILDSRERPLHRRLHGKVFRFDNPPVIDERTGQRGLPGETYNCRCSLTVLRLDSPFFDQAEIDRYANLKYNKIMADIPPTAQNSCIDATGRYHDDLGRFTNKIGWFVGGILSNNLQPITNAIKVGNLKENVIGYLQKVGIKIGSSEIDLTYGKVKHITRETKKEAQKVEPEQIKRAVQIIAENNVYYDTSKKNIIYVSKLPPNEINLGRDWIKIPVNLNYENGNNIIMTMSVIPAKDIFNDSKYEKID